MNKIQKKLAIRAFKELKKHFMKEYRKGYTKISVYPDLELSGRVVDSIILDKLLNYAYEGANPKNRIARFISLMLRLNNIKMTPESNYGVEIYLEVCGTLLES